MSEYKVGDKVRVHRFYTQKDRELLSRDKVYKVISIDTGGYPVIEADQFNTLGMLPHQLENVTGFTFAEIIQNMIDGEFEQGSVLKRDGRVLYVRKTLVGYGLSTSKDSIVLVEVPVSSHDINAIWTVEQPEAVFEEMTIEEIQEKLGHKIKIVEQPTRKGV